MQILARSFHFDSAKVKQQEKGWGVFNMNIKTLPIHTLHELHELITDELKQQKQLTPKLNIQVEKEWASLKKKLDQVIKEKDQVEQQ